MFKVLIVDDEPYIRKGLVNIIDWEKYDCKICAEAEDGLEGLEKMKEEKPEIVFVDINMPEIDGLEMIKKAKEIIPDSKFIILTGYRDFSYLQQAIKLGAFDYILKPSKIEEINEVFKKAVMELKYKEKRDKEIKKIKENFEKSIPILKEKLLFDIVEEYNFAKGEIEKQLELYNLEIGKFVFFIVKTDDGNKQGNETYKRQLYQFCIINTVKDMFPENFAIEKITLNTSEIAFIIQMKEKNEPNIQTIETTAESIQKLIGSCFDFTVTIAISEIGCGVEDLSKKAKECSDALDYTFYLGENSIILYKDISPFYKSEDFLGTDKFEKQLIKAIRTGNEKNVRDVLSDLQNEIINQDVNPNNAKKFYMDIMYIINDIRGSIKKTDKLTNRAQELSSLYNMIEESENIYKIHELLFDVAVGITKKINEYNKNKINVILQNAMEYINENYASSLTLDELAENMYVSTYYLSRMFTKELKKNFVDYLNEIRINKAKEFLEDNSMKIYEVAEKVGISDPHYFSKLFKKHTGETPSEYRQFN